MSVIDINEYKKKLEEQEDNKVLEAMMEQILPDEDVQKIIMALAEGQETFTKEDAFNAVAWAEEIAFGRLVLDMVLDGEILLVIDDEGEVCVKKK